MPNKELDLFKELIPSIDMGFKELYDAAGEDGKKDIKLDLWNLNRYISSVKGSYEKTALAVFKVNEYYNKNWNELVEQIMSNYNGNYCVLLVRQARNSFILGSD